MAQACSTSALVTRTLIGIWCYSCVKTRFQSGQKDVPSVGRNGVEHDGNRAVVRDITEVTFQRLTVHSSLEVTRRDDDGNVRAFSSHRAGELDRLAGRFTARAGQD